MEIVTQFMKVQPNIGGYRVKIEEMQDSISGVFDEVYDQDLVEILDCLFMFSKSLSDALGKAGERLSENYRHVTEDNYFNIAHDLREYQQKANEEIKALTDFHDDLHDHVERIETSDEDEYIDYGEITGKLREIVAKSKAVINDESIIAHLAGDLSVDYAAYANSQP